MPGAFVMSLKLGAEGHLPPPSARLEKYQRADKHIAAREASVSRHHGCPIDGPSKTPRTFTALPF